MNFIQVVGSPSCTFQAIVPDEIKNNTLEYMEVQILDSLSVRMRQQPKGVDHLRCSPTKTLLGNNIALYSTLELFCGMLCYQVF